ncbi:hypothetical protein QHH11_05760, partial [Aphanizomenon sp. PH219]|nr:hypothetical protein [Aphanizomenon sp. PH219]
DCFPSLAMTVNIFVQLLKRLINAFVLGLIFEKINGYKDGSSFTPGFITYLIKMVSSLTP